MKLINRQIDDNTIRSYSIKYHKSGIIELFIVTVDKWISHQFYNNNENYINEIELNDTYRLLIPELNITDEYIKSHRQEKDQITYYFISTKLLK